MCTAISDSHLFGRTLDLEYSYGEAVVVTPRNFAFDFIYEGENFSHPAIIGTAYVSGGYPLYYDAMNESGLAVAALNFPNCAVYRKYTCKKKNIASFELIPYLLSNCEDILSAKKLLENINIVSDSFSPSLTTTPLHWMIADKSGAIVAEPLSDGLKIYDNPFGVMTNAPTFPYHTTNLSNYMKLSPIPPKNDICPTAHLSPYSRGMGAFGLPGDLSSGSRFVRAVFAKSHTQKGDTSSANISRFFHIMDTVSQPRGIALTEDAQPISTVYTSCADLDSLCYYFTTYECRRIRGIRLNDIPPNSSKLTIFSMQENEDIKFLS
jgi:choloylglycine hydrolase